MDLKLAGQRALVTGSSSGIGSGVAAVLASEGVRVLVHGRDSVRTQQVADRIVAAGGWARAVLGDLTTDAGADAVAAEANRHLDGVDVLVNNAGGKAADPANPTFFEATWQEWLGTQVEANLGDYQAAKAAMTQLHLLKPHRC